MVGWLDSTAGVDALSENDRPRQCILVLGMHRSGTSALTRLVSILGAKLPTHLMVATPSNETGHWESQTLADYHDQFLGELDSRWDDWRKLELGRMPERRRQEVVTEISHVVDLEFPGARLFVLKDPRICRFVPLYLEAFDQTEITARSVLLIRNPLEVIASLERRDQMPRGEAALLWLRHALDAEAATRGRTRAFIRYDDLFIDWRRALTTLSTELDVTWPHSVADVTPQVGEFLTQSMRHHKHTTEDVLLDPITREWIAEAYSSFLTLATNPRSHSALIALDRIKQEFDRACPIMHRLESGIRNVHQDKLVEGESRIQQLAASLEDERARGNTLYASLADERERAKSLSAALADERERAKSLSGALADERERTQSLSAALEEERRNAQSLSAQLDLIQNGSGGVAALQQQVITLVEQLEHQRFETSEVDRRLQESAAALAALREQTPALRKAAEAREHAIKEITRSRSWRITAPLRALRGGGASGEGIIRDQPAIPPPIQTSAGSEDTLVAPQPGTRPPMVFFTIISRNFMAFAKTLFNSLKTHHPESQFFAALCDLPDPPFDATAEPFDFIYLDDLNLPQWREMAHRYNITEFNTSIKPAIFEYLFDRFPGHDVVYLDPDIFVVNRMEELEKAFASGAAAILTPHMTRPMEKAEMNEKRLLQYGIYNLGFLGLRNQPEVREIVRWWGRRLERECVIDREAGLFVDQKWADHFPAFMSDTHILRHPGYNVAYWNLSYRRVKWSSTDWTWMVNGEPLRFVHFSGNKLDDASVFSRHSSEHTPHSIGELSTLLDEYRQKIYANGHAKYSLIPYAFSWEGEKGVNEHTPRPQHQKASGQNGGRPEVTLSGVAANDRPPISVIGVSSPLNGPGAGSAVTLVSTAIAMAGSPTELVQKTAKAFQRGGVGEVRRQISRVREVARFDKRQTTCLEPTPDAGRLPLTWRKRLLFIDWSTPRPDKDSGSRTDFFLLKIFVQLNYDVTFIPGDLSFAGGYTEAVERLGVKCLDRSDVASIDHHLRSVGGCYDFVVLSRGPVAASLIVSVKAFCPNAKIIFNTVDLHYLRELREAEVSGTVHARKAALQTKADELNVAKESVLTIVLSKFEKEELEREVPGCNVKLIPLVFSEIDPDPPGWSQRSGIIFIGSFPHTPNVDAVRFFADSVFPKLQKARPEITWHIVGSDPPAEIVALGKRRGIVVHGFVPDLTPLFRSVRVSIAPLRYGAGIKGKIATSLAFGVPVVASSIAAEGMAIEEGTLVADDPDEFISSILSLYDDEKSWSRVSGSGQKLAIDQYSLPGNLLRTASAMKEIDNSLRDLQVFEFASQREFELAHECFSDKFVHRKDVELNLLPGDEGPFTIRGFCAVCGNERSFQASYMYSCQTTPDGRRIPNWREHLDCDTCGFIQRTRAALHYFYGHVRPDPSAAIYLTEQSTQLYRWMLERHPNLVGSEFLGSTVAFGQTTNGLRNEDLTRLTFGDAAFDYILSFDVMEHVSDDQAALAECYRSLKPGGVLLFTAPFAYDKANKVVRAVLLPDGQIRHILEPEFHGNPVDERGSLCFRYFAWDVLNDLKRAGFADAKIVNYWSRDYAYLGPFGFLVVARK